MRNHFSTFLIVAGLLIIIIPLSGRFIADRRQQEMMEAFEEEMAEADKAILGDNGTDISSNEVRDLTEALEWGIVEENQSLLDIGDSAARVTIDDLALGSDGEASGDLESAEQIKAKPKAIATMKIDKIDVYLPVAEGADLATLKFSLGHMSETDPLGAVGNAVVAGHRSHSFGTYFNRLDEVAVGDEIEVTTGGQTYVYEVYEVLIVEPDDLSVLRSSSTHRVLTLITCTPLYTSTHRLIVHAVVRE